MRRLYAPRRPVPNAYLVRERDRRRHRELAWVAVIVLSVGACLLAYVWLQVELLRTGYQVQDLEEELEQVLRRQGALELREAELSSPARIRERAAAELGMQPADGSRMIFEAEVP